VYFLIAVRRRSSAVVIGSGPGGLAGPGPEFGTGRGDRAGTLVRTSSQAPSRHYVRLVFVLRKANPPKGRDAKLPV
jgi:hypothetical protein